MEDNALEYSRRLYERVVDWYKNADSKAQITLTLNGVFVAFLTSSIFKNPTEVYGIINKFNALTWFFLTLMCVCLVGSIVCALLCLWSRIAFHPKRDKTLLAAIEEMKTRGEYLPEVMLFFKTIAMLDGEKFLAQLAKIDEDFEIKALGSQIHLLSKRVYVKHRVVNYSFALVGGALIFFLLGAAVYLLSLK